MSKTEALFGVNRGSVLFPVTELETELFPDPVLLIGFFFRIGNGKSDKADRMLLVFHCFQ